MKSIVASCVWTALTALSCLSTAHAGGRADWLRGSVGVSVHWTAAIPAADCSKVPFEEAVRRFDVKAFADTLASAGARHLIFTTAHGLQYLPMPNAALDAIEPGRTTERDLFGEILDACAERGIRVIAYYNHSCNASELDSWKRACACPFPAVDRDVRPFASNICAIVRCMSERYGRKLSGWWFDSSYSVDSRGPHTCVDGVWHDAGTNPYEGPEVVFPWDDLIAAARSGNPEAAVAINAGVARTFQCSADADYYAGETAEFDDEPDGPIPAGLVDTRWTTLDDPYWTFDAKRGFLPLRKSPSELRAWTLDHLAAGRAVTFNVLIDRAGRLNPAVAALKDVFAPPGAADTLRWTPAEELPRFGRQIRFRTDSSLVGFRSAGKEPFEAYVRAAGGAWRALASGTADRIRVAPGSEILVNAYDDRGIAGLTIGLASNAKADAVASGPNGKPPKPIVFYGTDENRLRRCPRPGLVYVNALARDLDVPVVCPDLGDGGRMEIGACGRLAEIEARCYVLDCLWNMSDAEVFARYEPFVRELRRRRPETPIVFIERTDEFCRPPSIGEKAVGRFYWRVRYEEGWKGLAYLQKSRMYEEDREAAVNGIRPIDLGSLPLVQGYEEVVRDVVDFGAKKKHVPTAGQERLFNAKWGTFTHYLGYGCRTPEEWNARVDSFDVEKFADAIASTGAKFHFLTLMQGVRWMCAPNATYDRLTRFKPGEACSRRDLVAEVADALGKRGVDLYLYYTSDGPYADQKAAGWFGFGNPTSVMGRPFVEKWAAVLEDFSLRYGPKVKGWWIDGCYRKWYKMSDELMALYAQAAKRGNPEAVVAMNDGVKDFYFKNYAGEDFTAGECNDFTMVPKERFVDGAQAFLLAPLGTPAPENPLGGAWGRRGCRHDGAYLRSFVRLVNANGGVVAIDIHVDPDGSLDPEQLAVVRAISE